MEIRPLETITRPGLFDCDISNDGAAVAAVYQEDEGQYLGIWSTTGCHPLLNVNLPGPYMRPRFSPDGRRLAASQGRGEELRAWSMPDGQEVFRLQSEGEEAIVSHAFGERGETLAVAQGDRVSVWSVENSEWLYAVPLPSEIDVLRASADGRLVAAGLHGGGAAVIDLGAREVIATLPNISQAVTEVGFHPSQPWLLTATAPSFARVGNRWQRTEHGWAYVWNYYTGEEIARIVCDYEAVLLGKGEYLATLTNNSRSLWIWQIVPETDLVAHIENAVPELVIDVNQRETRQATLAATPQGDLLAVAGLTRAVSAVGVLRLFAINVEAVPATAP